MAKSKSKAKSKTKAKAKSKATKKTAKKASKKKASLKSARASKSSKKKKASVKKKKAAPKKAAKKKAKKTAKKQSKASTPKKTKAAAPKAAMKGVIPLSNPFKLFMEVWNPKNEGFFHGIRRLFSEYAVPGKTDKQREENSAEIIEKIESAMRKESLSHDLIELLSERLSNERLHQMASIMSMKPRSTIRLNILKADINGFQAAKAGKELKVQRCEISPWGFDVVDGVNPLEHPVYERGLYELEDEGSQLLTLILNARPGQRVLDLCARDGDHTLGISAMMKNKGSLFVYDADPNRLKGVKARAQRAGVDNIRLLSDSQVGEVKSLDCVLIDAPSSSTGVLARQPEIKWRFKKEDLPKLQKVQAALLREGARKLKLGGRLVYATQSLSRSENEAQIEHFLKQAHNSYRLVPAIEYFRECIAPYAKNFYGLEYTEEQIASFSEADPYFMLYPDVHGCGGMFVAIIERTRISN